MPTPDLFLNRHGRLRAGWRLALFAALFAFTFVALLTALAIVASLFVSRERFERTLDVGEWGFVVQSLAMFAAAALVGWGCARFVEDLPWRSLGWTMHRGWLRDLLLGLAISAAAIGLVAVTGLVFGGYRFEPNWGTGWGAIWRTLAGSGLVLLLGAAAEEMLFRGYPLQTTLRSWPPAVALVLPSIVFAFVHLSNPNVSPFFTFINTFLAGVWLAAAYWRTRSLWLAFGLHWGWNWTMGAVLGSPISGIREITPAPVLRFEDAGPAWLGGGGYGFEGGAACTLALLALTAFVWRTRLLAPAPELRQFTDGENPGPERAALYPPRGGEAA
ncbi:MAG TPA: CPBP family intramembrane glutamic endopeptidase [Pyrinomonadaceae bacterium]|nr:CPBP family intramembrane glutamic endopeptidase [Pyrinomonadaceae bacterium]